MNSCFFILCRSTAANLYLNLSLALVIKWMHFDLKFRYFIKAEWFGSFFARFLSSISGLACASPMHVISTSSAKSRRIMNGSHDGKSFSLALARTPLRSEGSNEDLMRQNYITLVIVKTNINWLIKQQTALDLILYLDIVITNIILCQNKGLCQLTPSSYHLWLINFAKKGSITTVWSISRSLFCTAFPSWWGLLRSAGLQSLRVGVGWRAPFWFRITCNLK